MDVSAWPVVELLSVHVETSVRWNGLREVVPIFSRRPDRAWCSIFFDLCDAEEGIDWQGARFAYCKPDDLPRVERILRRLTTSANRRFTEFLSRAAEQQPKEVSELIALEGSLAASDNGEGYPCL